MLRMFPVRIPFALAAIVGLAAACLAGCSRDDLGEMPHQVETPGGELSPGTVYIRFQMNLDKVGIPADTRAEAAVPTEIFGSSRENAINTLDLLVYDAETDDLKSIIPVGKERIAQINSSGSVCLPILVNEELKLKKVHIYAAANLTQKMRELLTPGLSSKYFFVSTQNDYWKVIDEFVPGCVGRQELLESSGGSIPMTGQFKTDTDKSGDIEFTDAYTSEATALHVSADLCRMVAKVHVTAKATPYTLSDGQNVSYVDTEDKTAATVADPAEDYSNWIGWIRLANVRYMPNGVNKSTYLFPQPTGRSGYPLWQDRNMDLESYVSGGQFNAPRWTRDFCFCNVLALHRENATSAHRLAQVEAYDDERLPGGTKEPYTRGMYCTENYFDRPTSATADLFNRFENRKSGDAIPMVTSVYVAAKLTPRNIVIVADYQTRMEAFVDEFRNTPDEFREKYGLIESDFTHEDEVLWTVLKERYKEYFTGDAALYRGSFRIIRTLSEKDAAAIINWSLMSNGLWSGDDSVFENGKYPAATFYVYDTDYDLSQGLDEQWTQQYLYLTAGAVASATDANMRIKTYSVPHLGGWGYYYTYLNQTGESYTDTTGEIVEGRAPYTASQVTRNTYYLLTVWNFGVPGGTITRPEYIKVNTVPVDWDYGGRGDIDLH